MVVLEGNYVQEIALRPVIASRTASDVSHML
jgi:hypothetical protein